MSSNEIGGEAAVAILPGALVESMQAGLNRILGLEQTFDEIERRQALFMGSAGVDLDVVTWSVRKVQQSMGTGEPTSAFEFLEDDHSSRYGYVHYAKAGYAALLLASRDRIIGRERRVWARSGDDREWIGRHVILQPPSLAVTQNSSDWGNRAPRYRELAGDEPASPYHGGTEHNGHTYGFYGTLRLVSLDEAGTVILDREDGGTTQVKELFEPVKDPETSKVTKYVPRVAIQLEARVARLKRHARNAAMNQRVAAPLEPSGQ